MKTRKVILNTIAAIAAVSIAVSSHAGPRDGGGGGPLPERKVMPWEIKRIIQNAKKSLVPIVLSGLSMYSWGDTDKKSDVDKILYGRKPNLYDALMNTDIEVNYDSPCVNPVNGELMPASSKGESENAICISASEMAKILVPERAQNEILGTIIHELSHTLGINDEEIATEIQRTYVGYLNYNNDLVENNSLTAEGYIAETEKLAHAMRDAFSEIKIDKNTTFKKLGEAVDRANFATVKFSDTERKFPRALLDDKEFAYYEIQSLRLRMLNWYFLSQKNKYWLEKLNNVFGKSKSITFGEYMKNFRDLVAVENNPYSNEIIERVQTLEQAKSQFLELSKYFHALSYRPNMIRMGHRFNLLPIPDYRQTAFSQFEGQYRVESASCTNNETPENITKLSIVKDRNHKYYMPVEGPGYLSHWDDLYSGGQSSRGGTYLQVDGGQNWAKRTIEFGDRWNVQELARDFWQNTLEFRKENERFTVTVKSLSRKEKNLGNYRHKYEDTVSTCKYNLVQLR